MPASQKKLLSGHAMASMVSNGGFNVHQCGSWPVANFDGRIYFHKNIVVQFGLWCRYE